MCRAVMLLPNWLQAWDDVLVVLRASLGGPQQREQVPVDAVVARDTPGQHQEEGQRSIDTYRARQQEVQVHKEPEESRNPG